MFAESNNAEPIREYGESNTVTSQDNNGKEQEMQIGYPTDVKHVAHIGWEGPSVVHSPTWMDEFRQEPFSSAPLSINGDTNESNCKDASSKDLHGTGAGIDGSTDIPSLLDSPNKDQSKQTRRHQSLTTVTGDVKESSSRSSSRRSQNIGLSMDSSLQDQTTDPKKSRRKKTKGISNGGSTRPSRSKPQSSNTTYTSPFSDPGSGTVCDLTNGICPTSPLKSMGIQEGDKGNQGIS
ncbi:CRIB domain-containing protein RIC7-like [Telopea speciosissima]|uniref:CRIB domain-containing protein RIC7-like n=1 Tax=Telopea speciosissima TaxID=54955 RepID=UPI001CC626F3|nr:CRIB domain-containing protein RIC7-like [Telopea speciosissima]